MATKRHIPEDINPFQLRHIHATEKKLHKRYMSSTSLYLVVLSFLNILIRAILNTQEQSGCRSTKTRVLYLCGAVWFASLQTMCTHKMSN